MYTMDVYSDEKTSQRKKTILLYLLDQSTPVGWVNQYTGHFICWWNSKVTVTRNSSPSAWPL